MKKNKITAVLLSLLMLTLSFSGLFSGVAFAAEEEWVSVWGSSLVNGSVSIAAASVQDVILAGSTLRTRLTVTKGGTALRFVFSNQYGAAPITINGASVARAGAGNTEIVDGTQTPITFGGEASVSIPAGERVYSDVVEFTTSALEEISVSLYFASFTYMTSVGLSNGRTFMRRLPLSTSSRINDTVLTGANEVNIASGTITYHTIPFLERIDARSSSDSVAAVFIGDSTLVNDTYLYYARRIVSAGYTNISVVNEAVIGNKLLSNGSGLIGNLYGQAMIDRFQRDVLDLPGVKYCFVKIGLNDVLHQFSNSLKAATPAYSPEDIVSGYRTLISLCHANGIKIYFFTKSAWNGYERSFLGQSGDLVWNPTAQEMCDKLTHWIMTNTEADGFIDCSPLADPSETSRLCPSFTLDGAHLTELGSIALADLIPLEYVGIPAGRGRTAASIAGVDPYAEKFEIIRRMNEPPTTQAPPTTAAPETPATTLPPVTVPPTTLPPVTVPTTEPFTVPTTDNSLPVFAPPVTQPEAPTTPYEEPATVPYAQNPDVPNQEVIYNVQETPDVNSIGSGSSIAFILVLTTALVATAAVVILTVGKKKEV